MPFSFCGLKVMYLIRHISLPYSESSQSQNSISGTASRGGSGRAALPSPVMHEIPLSANRCQIIFSQKSEERRKKKKKKKQKQKGEEAAGGDGIPPPRWVWLWVAKQEVRCRRRRGRGRPAPRRGEGEGRPPPPGPAPPAPPRRGPPRRPLLSAQVPGRPAESCQRLPAGLGPAAGSRRRVPQGGGAEAGSRPAGGTAVPPPRR